MTVAWGQQWTVGNVVTEGGMEGCEGVGICQRDMQPTGGQFRREAYESSSVPRHP